MPIASELKEFIMHGNVIDLAVGIVIGTVFSDVVESLVDGIIMPPAGTPIGSVDFSNLFITLKDGTPAPEVGCASLTATKAAGVVALNVDLFISTIISFLITAAAIFVVVKLLNSLKKKEVPVEEALAEPNEEILLLREIRDSLDKR